MDDITCPIDKNLACNKVIMNYVPNTLSKYQLYPKKWYRNGQQDSNSISVLGMNYNHKEDTIGQKEIVIHNGKKYREELRIMKGPLIVVNTSNDNMEEETKELLKQIPETLRSILGYCNQFYDIKGFIMPLHNQLRAVAIDIMIDKYNYDDELTDNIWKYFETCLLELIKANKFTYKRRPNEEILKSDGRKLIVTYAHYSMAWV